MGIIGICKCATSVSETNSSKETRWSSQYSIPDWVLKLSMEHPDTKNQNSGGYRVHEYQKLNMQTLELSRHILSVDGKHVII